MLINTTNNRQANIPAPQQRGGVYAVLFWTCAALFVSADTPLLDNSKPQIKKETFQSYLVENSTFILNKQTETEYNIYGKVIQFTDYKVDEKGASSLLYRTLHKYDSYGNRIGTHKYNQDGDLIWSEDVLLNDQGRRTRVNNASYHPTHIRTYTLYDYDENGNEVLVRFFNEKDEQTNEIARSYTPDGEVLTVNRWSYEWNEDDKWVKKLVRTENEYNAMGQLTRSSTETTIGRNKWKEVQFFENGYLSEWLKYENSKLTSQFKHQKRDTVSIEKQYEIPPPIPFQDPFLEYDDAKRDPLEHISHTPISTVTLKQDQNGNIIKKVVREHGQVTQVIYYEYDELNNLINQKTIHKPEERTEEIRRSYDKHSNLVKEQHFKEGVQESEISLVYQYYE